MPGWADSTRGTSVIMLEVTIVSRACHQDMPAQAGTLGCQGLAGNAGGAAEPAGPPWACQGSAGKTSEERCRWRLSPVDAWELVQ